MMNNILKKMKEEGDSKAWIFECENGVKVQCLIERHTTLKHLCGYILLYPDNKYYGKGYDDIFVDVHGGLTYAGECYVEGYKGWMIGFDCGHYDDFVYTTHYQIGSGIYRDMEYVISECESMADQTSEFNIPKIRDKKIDVLLK